MGGRAGSGIIATGSSCGRGARIGAIIASSPVRARDEADDPFEGEEDGIRGAN